MFKMISDMLAKLGVGSARQALPDSLAEKMRDMTWAPTEDDRSAMKSLAEDEARAQAPLAEIMASNYVGRSGERFID